MSRARLAAVVALAALTVASVVALAVDGPGRGDRDEAATAATAPAPGDAGATTAPAAHGAASSTSAPEPATTTTTEPRGRRGSGRPVTFAFAGDVHFEGVLRGQLAADPQGVLAPIAPVLSEADVAVVNLETAVTERGTPAPKEFTFRASPQALVALRAAGVDAATMANNHGLDFGLQGLEDSLAAGEFLDFPLVGIGRDASSAYAPFETVVDGQRIAVIGATQVLDSALITAWTATDTQAGLASAKEVERLLAEVRAARERSDTVVVFLHWGTELMTCPQEAQQTLARQLVDAGADIVVGGHAHRLQGAGRLDGALVAYGLGNFAFYSPPGPGAETGVLLVTATGRDVESYEWRPAVIRSGVPYPLDGPDADAARQRWDALRPCTGLAA